MGCKTKSKKKKKGVRKLSEIKTEVLLSLCEQWQRNLRLQDWDIVIKLRPFREMIDCRGETRYNLEKKAAIITLLDPNDHDGNEDFPYDMELTLVHEMLHLHFVDGSHTPEECPTVFEQGINAVSAALVGLSRR